ncbi:hypothetical protein LCGC14_2873940 [marine sediment metagenome]|uniref:DUF1353 domain-containing protein n=1 Tax=marine sediment metagenome TaxID=412755 RepID=A0A0F8YNX8_9ZZZZ
MKYRKVNAKYRLAEKEYFITPIHPHVDIITKYITLKTSGEMILDDFIWDGASGPAIDFRFSKRGSAFHDACCWLMRNGYLDKDVYLKIVNDFTYKIWRIDKMPWIMAKWRVRILNKLDFYADPKNKAKIYTAP